MSKTLCKLVKENYLEDKMDEYIKIIKSPKYVCKKCGRVADEEERLCKPKKIKS